MGNHGSARAALRVAGPRRRITFQERRYGSGRGDALGGGAPPVRSVACLATIRVPPRDRALVRRRRGLASRKRRRARVDRGGRPCGAHRRVAALRRPVDGQWFGFLASDTRVCQRRDPHEAPVRQRMRSSIRSGCPLRVNGGRAAPARYPSRHRADVPQRWVSPSVRRLAGLSLSLAYSVRFGSRGSCEIVVGPSTATSCASCRSSATFAAQGATAVRRLGVPTGQSARILGKGGRGSSGGGRPGGPLRPSSTCGWASGERRFRPELARAHRPAAFVRDLPGALRPYFATNATLEMLTGLDDAASNSTLGGMTHTQDPHPGRRPRGARRRLRGYVAPEDARPPKPRGRIVFVAGADPGRPHGYGRRRECG